MAKKIKITEGQLKKVVNVITEENYDDAITKYQKEKSKEIQMSGEEARLLYNLAQNWCEGNVNHPDCEEVTELGRKLKIQ
jgi:predicted DNA-binding antitoxin AbrB/MazE fold protein